MVRLGHRKAVWALGLLVGAVNLSCGGVGTDETMSSPSAAQNESAGAATAFSTSAASKTLVCHKGEDKWVPSGALDVHKAHGDTEGACCPCFSLDDIEAVVGSCVADSSQTVVASCTSSNGLSLALTCTAGDGNGNTDPLGSYALSDSGDPYCLRYQDVLIGTLGPVSLTGSEPAACSRVLTSTGYCS